MDNSNNDENSHPHVDSSFLPTSRTIFTNLSQVDADLSLARTLQHQERAFMMLSTNGGGSDLDDDDDDDEFDQRNTEYDGNSYAEEEDAAFDNESGEVDRRGNHGVDLNGMVVEEVDMEENGDNYQDSWDDVDPDELSYEELIALGEVVGTESRGLSADSIASLSSLIYKTKNSQTGSNESCVICRLDYEDGDNLILLSCKHSYHSACITNWLQINNVCPVCSTEVSRSSTAG